ncbi:MAG: nucleotidyltransferase domain-containing protein [Gammaproteobacteria bacterium]|nr:nucleotidyltransferase domain-containing protein [Gammaproteobacteria bacterium]
MLLEYQFLKKLQQEACVKRLVLFGSRARGDASERSDIDLAIDCPHASAMEWQKLLDIIEDADSLLKVDCIRYDRLSPENELKQQIDQEGVELYVNRKA